MEIVQVKCINHWNKSEKEKWYTVNHWNFELCEILGFQNDPFHEDSIQNPTHEQSNFIYYSNLCQYRQQLTQHFQLSRLLFKIKQQILTLQIENKWNSMAWTLSSAKMSHFTP